MEGSSTMERGTNSNSIVMYMYVSMYVCISDPGKRVRGEAKVQEESSLGSVDRGAGRRRERSEWVLGW